VTQPTSSGTATSWRYVAEYNNGKIVRGQVKARDEDDALRLIRAMGATPVELAPLLHQNALLSSSRTRLNHSESLEFVRGLADLVEAGIPLRDALSSLLRREKRPVLRRFLERIEARVRGGEALSKALKADPADVYSLMVALTAAGEVSGLLGRNLTELASQMEAEQDLREEVIGQLIYPLALVVLFAVTLLFLAFFVLPKFEEIFADAVATPPAVTVFVLAAGAFLRSYAVWVPVGVVAGYMILRTMAQRYRIALEGVVLKTPLIGSTLKKRDAARYCRTLSLLLSTGSPMAKAEPVARSAVGSDGLKMRLRVAAEAVRSGEKLSTAMEREGALPDDALRFIELGEQTGQLDSMLKRTAELYEREVRTTTKRSAELIGPLMIVILAVFVGGVIAAVMLGVLSLNDVVY
jgi:type II secretory pathway component PulF